MIDPVLLVEAVERGLRLLGSDLQGWWDRDSDRMFDLVYGAAAAWLSANYSRWPQEDEVRGAFHAVLKARGIVGVP